MKTVAPVAATACDWRLQAQPSVVSLGNFVDFLRFTKDRAVLVEGYAAAGTPDEQFLNSLERATKARDYLVQKFRLSPDYVGVMPMGAVAEYGEGIALVLLRK